MLPYQNPAMPLDDSGYDIPPHGLNEADLQALSREFPPSSPNRRNLFVFSPLVESLVKRGSFSHLAQEVLGEKAFAVRAIFFNKIEKANWHVPWHQDIGIPIRERRDVPGFSAFTRKDGILHVNAPSIVLENLLILRLHLDECTATNGAMRLIPGSHLQGRIHDHNIHPQSEAQPEVPAGGILRLRPLLLHASAHTRSDAPRRVVHIEYAVDDLPGGLEWATRVYPD